MRFSCTNDWASGRPPPGGPNIAVSGTQTSVNDTRGWSVGMLKVHRYCSTFTPSSLVGASRQVIPLAAPSGPSVRQKTAQWVAWCMPLVHIFSPLIRNPGTPLRLSGTARVAMWVASEPW